MATTIGAVNRAVRAATPGRRELLGAALAIAAQSSFDPVRAAAISGFDWRQCAGQHLEVVWQRSSDVEHLQRHAAEFRDLTGIDVAWDVAPEQQFRQKLVIEFTSGHPSFDICYLAYTSQKRLFGRGKWLLDLRPLMSDPSITSPDFDWADFPATSVAAATQADGRIDTLPITFGYNILMWNKAMFRAKGLTCPTDFPSLLAAAKALHDPKNGISGFVGRGMKNANTPMWTGFLMGYGVEPVGAGGELFTDGAASVAAASLYQGLDRDYGPPGVVGYNWYECQTNFMLGRAAIYLDTSTIAAKVNDPSVSRIADNVGYAVFPAGPAIRRAPTFGDGLGIVPGSQRRTAAWLFLQWATGKTMQARQFIDGAGAPARSSAFAAAKAIPPRNAAEAEWLDAVTASRDIAWPAMPDIVAVNEFRDVYGAALSNMLGGADPQTELRRATAVFKGVYERTEKG
jgi:multiple sugar transport system substrate-binding protein